MTDSSTTATATAAPRGWRSLLTGRWHRSSWVVAVLVLLFLVFCNLPGQFTFSATSFSQSDAELTEWYMGRQLEHGWPLTYLVRTISESPNADAPTLGRCWQVWTGNQKLSFLPLLVNLATCLLLSFVLGVAFEAWRRGRRRLFQFHLRDAATVTLLICVFVGWLANVLRNRAPEFATLTRYPGIHAERERTGGITWLRLLVGEKSFEPLDDLSITIAGVLAANVVEEMPRFTGVKKVVAGATLTNEDLAILKKFPHVEELELWQPRKGTGLPSFSAGSLQIPKLTNLRGLIVFEPDAPLAGLSECVSLESLTAFEAPIDEAMMRELALLPSLKALYLNVCELQPEAQQQLSSLKHLQRLDLTMGAVADEPLLAQVGQLQHLRQLYLSAEQFPPAAFEHVGRLVELRYLELHCVFSDISAKDLRHLASLPELRCLNVSATPVAPALTPELGRMRQLRKLVVSDHHFSPSDLVRLQQLLPKCEVIGTHDQGTF